MTDNGSKPSPRRAPRLRPARRIPALLLAALLLLPGAAAGGSFVTLTEGAPVSAMRSTVSDYSGTVTLTFLGDCTLGGETRTRGAATGFPRTVEKEGLGFPFRQLAALTRTDDVTVANLEGVLTDRELEKEPKTFNFSGSAAYAEVLTRGGIECVTLANNHSHDYGEAGYADTKAALGAAGVAWFGADAPALWDSGDGVRVGFIGVHYSLYEGQLPAFRAQMEALREAGCMAVIVVMHAGEEYQSAVSPLQAQIVDAAVREGADLVVGHHPHIVQGFALRDGVPVAYSLGNCVFGGSLRLKDNDALALRTELRFDEGELAETVLRFYPVTATTNAPYNNYSPGFLTGADAERVLRKMRESTGTDVGAFDEEGGAAVVVPAR